MEATLYYLFKSAACLSVFYLCYKLLLSRETWHRMNRMVLLFTSAAAFVLPLCIITIYREVPMNTQISIGELGTMAEIADETFQLSWSMLVFAIFIVGCAVRLCYTIYSIYKVRKIIRSGTHTECDNGTVLVQVAEEIPPFSWMKYIVISEKDYAENPTEIITHEQAHISLRHSFDILFVDLITCVQWFNPVMYLLRDDLREIHEYEADETVLNSGINAQQYQILLIKKAAGAKWYSIANSFNHSKLKNRITMMMKAKSSKWARAKVLCFIPLVCVALTMFARVEDVYAEADKTPQQVTPKSKENISDQTFMAVEHMPEFPGGQQAMLQFIADNIKYPAEAVKDKSQGTCICQFVVQKDGSIGDVTVLRSSDYAILDQEAIRVLKSMPKWTPGQQRGEVVNVKIAVPIAFKL